MIDTASRSGLRTVGTKELFVEETGAGTPVVLVHGLGGTTNFYQPLVETLAAGHRVVRYDFNGHGRSPLTPPVCQRALTIDLVALIESLGAGPVHLVAHSMGTLVAQLVAATRPELIDRIVLLGAVRAQPEPAREATRTRAALVREHGMSAVADLIPVAATAEAAASANPLVRPFIREMLLGQTPEGYAQACEALASALNPDLARITSPTLLITGEQDKVGTPAASQSIAEEIPEAQVQLLPGVGHWTVTEAPTEVATRLAAFLTPTTDRSGI